MWILTKRKYKLRLSRWSWKSAHTTKPLRKPQMRKSLQRRRVPLNTPLPRSPTLRPSVTRNFLWCNRCKCLRPHRLVILTLQLSGINFWWISRSSSSKSNRSFSFSRFNNRIRRCPTSQTRAPYCHKWVAYPMGKVFKTPSSSSSNLNWKKKTKKQNGTKTPSKSAMTKWKNSRPNPTSSK